MCAVTHDEFSMPSEAELLESKECDTYCKNLKKMVSVESSFVFNEKCVLCRQAAVNGCNQIVVPERQRTALLYNAHYQKLAGHPVTRRMYDILRQHYYWPHMPKDVHAMLTFFSVNFAKDAEHSVNISSCLSCFHRRDIWSLSGLISLACLHKQNKGTGSSSWFRTGTRSWQE